MLNVNNASVIATKFGVTLSALRFQRNMRETQLLALFLAPLVQLSIACCMEQGGESLGMGLVACGESLGMRLVACVGRAWE